VLPAHPSPPGIVAHESPSSGGLIVDRSGNSRQGHGQRVHRRGRPGTRLPHAPDVLNLLTANPSALWVTPDHSSRLQSVVWWLNDAGRLSPHLRASEGFWSRGSPRGRRLGRGIPLDRRPAPAENPVTRWSSALGPGGRAAAGGRAKGLRTAVPSTGRLYRLCSIPPRLFH
jgi:hypothetical protein